ncbi:hypothetical protein MZD04_gp020 [Pseudomonas phage Psa21]|uniref:Uncharacterized protein n=1 Tax=Pseudomonas phage Psa21 TaxID=2530023 RepID=A0A481W4A0_9CAUD|nr:hypothetical protein MZD04_gp020 [Pseudomonas phage Psa21]QBJ02550.1 hypothetical protein PSA21_20 [Pseudomonas phage Psa21]
MITIELTQTEIAEHFGCPVARAEEVTRRLFLTSFVSPLPSILRVNIAETPAEYSGQIMATLKSVTVQRRGWDGNKVKDKATLLAYIRESAKALIDLRVWDEYNGPKAEVLPIPEPVEPERHYSLPGKYAVYPPSGPAE